MITAIKLFFLLLNRRNILVSLMCVFYGVTAVKRNFNQPMFKTAPSHLPDKVTDQLTPVGQVSQDGNNTIKAQCA